LGFFIIGILFSVLAFLIEYVIIDLENENQEIDLISFMKDYVDVKGNLFLIIFLALFPISLYMNYTSIKAKDAIVYILIIVTGYAWFGVLIMVIEDYGIFQFPN